VRVRCIYRIASCEMRGYWKLDEVAGCGATSGFILIIRYHGNQVLTGRPGVLGDDRQGAALIASISGNLRFFHIRTGLSGMFIKKQPRKGGWRSTIESSFQPMQDRPPPSFPRRHSLRTLQEAGIFSLFTGRATAGYWLSTVAPLAVRLPPIVYFKIIRGWR